MHAGPGPSGIKNGALSVVGIDVDKSKSVLADGSRFALAAWTFVGAATVHPTRRRKTQVVVNIMLPVSSS